MAKSRSTNHVQLPSSNHPLANCRPRWDRVVIRRDLAKRETEGGILLPETVSNKQQTGTVVKVGPGRQTIEGKIVPMDLKPGDRVIITNYAGLEIRDPTTASSNDEYIILREDDVLAVLER